MSDLRADKAGVGSSSLPRPTIKAPPVAEFHGKQVIVTGSLWSSILVLSSQLPPSTLQKWTPKWTPHSRLTEYPWQDPR